MKKHLLTLSGSVVMLVSAFAGGHYIGYDKASETYGAKVVVAKKEVNKLAETNGNLRNAIDSLKDGNTILQHELESKPVTINTVSQLSYEEGFHVGKFSITAYSPYEDYNGLNSDGDPHVTATGTTPKPGTFAVDPHVIPLGSNMIIMYPDGTIERGHAEDTGGAIKQNRIDVFRTTYNAALDFGRRAAVVIWYKGETK